MIPNIEPSGTFVHPDYAPSRLRPHPRRHLVVALLAFTIVLVIAAGIASAADWQMVVTEPGREPFVKHTFDQLTACTTDSVGQAIVRPKGTQIVCLRVVPAKAAAK